MEQSTTTPEAVARIRASLLPDIDFQSDLASAEDPRRISPRS